MECRNGGLPGGYHNTGGGMLTYSRDNDWRADNDHYRNIGKTGYWWTSTADDRDNGTAHYMPMYKQGGDGSSTVSNNDIGYSVRCVQD